MFRQPAEVVYRDGTKAYCTLTQWSMAQFATYAAAKGITVDLESPGLMGVVMIRYQAWAELHRDPSTPRPAFDKWDATVDEVTPGDAVEVPPTGPAT